MGKKMNPVVFYLLILVYVILALLLRCAAFAPLLALTAFESGNWLRNIAWLCPALLLFVILPLRFSFAAELVQQPRERKFSIGKAFSFSQYAEKLVQSIAHLLHVLLWGIPFFCVAGYGFALYEEGELLTLNTFDAVTAIGNGWNDIQYKVINFFRGLFGNAALVRPANGFMDGIYVILAIVLITLLIWLYGAVRNSATRYIWVLAERNNRRLSTERHHHLSGRRWAQLGTALFNLVLCIPFFAVSYMLCKEHVDNLLSVQTLTMIFQTRTLPQLDWQQLLCKLAISFAACYLTLIPARRWLTCRYATGSRRHNRK